MGGRGEGILLILMSYTCTCALFCMCNQLRLPACFSRRFFPPTPEHEALHTPSSLLIWAEWSCEISGGDLGVGAFMSFSSAPEEAGLVLLRVSAPREEAQTA